MNFENEIWKDIPNYEGLYQVSNLGRVKMLPRKFPRNDGGVIRHKERILNQTLNNYYYVQLRKDRKNIHFAVHRLVCMAFHKNPNNYPYVNHKDENKLNNHVDNLEWCTQKYNVNYGNQAKTRRQRYIKKMGKPICVYDRYGVLVKEYPSISSAIDDGFDRHSVQYCLLGKLDSHRDLVFKHKGEPFKYKNRQRNIVVRRFSEEGGLVKEYNSILDASKDCDVTKDKLSAIYRGKQPNKPINGYRYEFLQPISSSEIKE